MPSVSSYRLTDAKKVLSTLKSVGDIKEIRVPKYGSVGEEVNLQEGLNVIKDFGDTFLGTDYAIKVFVAMVEQMQVQSSRAQESAIILIRLAEEQRIMIDELEKENADLAEDYQELLALVGVKIASPEEASEKKGVDTDEQSENGEPSLLDSDSIYEKMKAQATANPPKSRWKKNKSEDDDEDDA